jgi:NADH-quinone oxidoreductase subunit J
MRIEGWHQVFFFLLGGWTLAAGTLVVLLRNPVHCALALVSALVTIAGIFVLLGAEFLAGAQILIYVGGVMVLFLFVIMLVNVGGEEATGVPVFTRQGAVAVVFTVVLAVAFVLAVRAAAPVLEVRRPVAVAPDSRGNTAAVGADLYERAALPFEIASILLLVAIVGSVLLARERKQEKFFD